MEYDVVIVGAGPSGLAAAIRFKQLCLDDGVDYSVCVIEKGSQVGAHILSGAVLEPRALNELLPDWQQLDHPLKTPVADDHFALLTKSSALKLPTPPQMHNDGNYIISLGNFCKFLAEQAESLGVDIFPGFAAADVLYDDNNQVIGIISGEMGVDKDGNHKDTYQPGLELHAKHTLFAEGCHGSLTKQLITHYNLREGKQPQTYALGIKELWEVDPTQHQPGLVFHSVGWPLDSKTYGGSFIYHLENNQVAVGFVVALDYQNPYLNPFEEMQRFKTHPMIRATFENAKRVSYGARALNEGGLQSIPKLEFPGGLLIGDCAGFLNVPKIKGTHTAMKSGMLAAESVFENLHQQTAIAYEKNLKQSWVWKELHQVRNIRPGFKWGLYPGLLYAAIDTYVCRGKAPWTFKHHVDHLSLKPKSQCKPIDYPKPDNKITFDKLSSVYLANTEHDEDQPCHLQLADPKIAIDVNLKQYDSPESKYCPTNVYEIVDGKLKINASNCVHCKTCDIKDPKQNINWVTPEGGSGPNYSNM